MTRAAVVWSESNELRCRQLSESAENIVSRSPDATVFLTDRAVSRSPHADFRYVNGAFVVEHLRTGVMPTLVNDAPIDGATQLSDQDVVQIGSTRLVFHDLSTHDNARLVCSAATATPRMTSTAPNAGDAARTWPTPDRRCIRPPALNVASWLRPPHPPTYSGTIPSS